MGELEGTIEGSALGEELGDPEGTSLLLVGAMVGLRVQELQAF